MTSQVLLFDSETATVATDISEAEGGASHRFSGRIMPDRVRIVLLSDASFSAMTVASRSGVVTIETDTNNTIIVEPGAPVSAIIESSATRVTFSTEDPDGADIEYHVWSTATEAPGQSPFLILNAGLGTEFDFYSGLMTGWTDIRSVTLAPLQFTNPDGAELIASDPDFNGKPSVLFQHAGSGRFSYVDEATYGSTFGFLDGGSDWCAMGIVYFYDDMPATNNRWASLFAAREQTSAKRLRAIIDCGYRLGFSRLSAPTIDTLAEGELENKPCVVFFQYTAATKTMRIYYQGKWRATIVDAEAVWSVGALSFSVGGSSSEDNKHHKIADFRMYNRLITPEEFQSYVDLAVNEYGIDDSQGYVFPFVTDSKMYIRATRGILLEPNTDDVIASFRDARLESDDLLVFEPYADSPSRRTADPMANDRPSIRFDDSEMANTIAGFYDEMSGGVGAGATIICLYYLDSYGIGTYRPIIGQGSYDVTSLNGSIFGYVDSNTRLQYETDNASNDNIVRDNGSNVIPMFEPVLVIYRLDANAETYSIFEYAPNSNHRMHSQKNLAYDGTPATTASNTLTLFATPNHTYRTDGGLMELCLMTRPITDAEIEDVIRYVRHVYPAS